jgi:hypothetical protein
MAGKSGRLGEHNYNWVPGVDFIKVKSWAFFIDIAVSMYALHLSQTFTPQKASQKLGIGPNINVCEMDPW